MSTRSQLLALNDELRRLKAAGHRTVTVSDGSLAQLREAINSGGNDEEGDPEIQPPLVQVKPAVHKSPVASSASPAPRPSAPTDSPSTSKLPAQPPLVKLPEGDKASRWAALRELVLNHPVCLAHVRPEKKVVLGVGNLDAQIFFCGEAPGAEEEEQGEPFVGPAGQLLTRMIQGMGLTREQVYIGNIMNWRPEMPTAPGAAQYGNRPPTPEEMNFCLPFLRAQLEIVQPAVIVALGKTAAEGLLGAGTFRTLGEIRGRWQTFNDVPLIVTYHPSYILRNPTHSSKRAIWEDLLKVMERVELPVSEKQRKFFS